MIMLSAAMLRLLLLIVLLGRHLATTHAHCHLRGCPLALASYYVSSPGTSLSYISSLFSTPVSLILPFNPSLVVATATGLVVSTRVNVPFPCTTCFNNDSATRDHVSFLGHTFSYGFQFNDTYTSVARTIYSNLTTEELMVRFNVYPEDDTPDGASINVTVRCFCGDEDVSKEYGLFVTYPLRDGESLESVAEAAGVAPEVVQRYNVGVDFSDGGGVVVFVPGKDQNGVFPPMTLSSGVGKKVVISVPVVAVVMILLLAVYIILRRKNHVVIDDSKSDLSKNLRAVLSPSVGASPLFQHVAVERSVEFTYEELAQATNNFNASNKIGEGGFGWVFFAELRGQKAAVKKLKMKASKSFLTELKILTNVNHMNLVRLIGFCIERSLILVYEFIDNGNLSEHLRGPGRDPLPWLTRVQIALDSARGIHYIHEHTVPAYIHRDIKTDNILIDKNFRAKVSDFGLTKLMELGSETSHTENAAGTFGYMPTEYAQYGSLSPKNDVYGFGVMLFELISARRAIVEEIGEVAVPQKLSTLFDDALRRRNPVQNLKELVDPALGDDYPVESIYKMAMLARACTLDDPKLRPNMRAVCVALETLSTNAEDRSTALFISDEVVKLLTLETPASGSDVP